MHKTTREIVCIVSTDIVDFQDISSRDHFLASQILEKSINIQMPIIEVYGGTCILENENNILATFASATDSVMAAAAVQYACSLEQDLNLKIGIHLGELEFIENGAFGEAIDIAMHIQKSAPPGGIFISDPVKKNLANKKGIETIFNGPMSFEELSEDIPIYQLKINGDYRNTDFQDIPLDKTTVLRSDKSIAVLPFSDLDADPDKEYFGDGMAEEIINTLSNLRELKVICRSSSFQFKGKKISISDIGKQLGVSKILTGNVRSENNRLMVFARLLNAVNKEEIWSEIFDRELTDLFEVQDEIANAIARELQITILNSEKEFQAKIPTENFEAYEIYLKGHFFWNKRGKWLVNGLQHFEQAIELDPEFALAHACLADAYAALGMYGIIAPDIAMPKGKTAALKAISLDKNVCPAYCALAFITGFYENNFAEARQLFENTINLFPNEASAHYWYSFYLNVVGKDYKKAEELSFKSLLLEPHNAVACHIAGLSYFAERNFEDAMILSRRAIAIDSALFLPYFLLGWCQLETGETSAAIQTLQFGLNLSGRHSWPLGIMIMAKVRNGEMEEAKLLLDEIVERDRSQFFSTFGSVLGAIALHNYDLALAFLEKGLKNKDILLPIFTHKSIMPSNLLDNPQIMAVIKKIKIP